MTVSSTSGGRVETIVERPAALDVHKAQVTACVRVSNDRGEREQRIAEFATTVRGLLALRDWLTAHRVQQVVMEATGVYWKAPWAILEDDFECLLVNARHVKQVGELAANVGRGVVFLYDEAHTVHDRPRKHEFPLSTLLGAFVQVQDDPDYDLPVMLVVCGLPPLVNQLQSARQPLGTLLQGGGTRLPRPGARTGAKR
jgi:hypothetical protein